jgi:uncharacterized protein (DUF736 family)
MSDNSEKTSIKVGAGWTKEGKSGNVYVSVSLDAVKIAELTAEIAANGGNGEKLNVGMFENTKKKTDNQPDYYFMYFRRG